MKALPLVVVALLLLVVQAPLTCVAAAPAPQFRAYWVDAFGPGLYTPEQITQLVADTKAANLNAIVAQVVRRADCLCNRALAPRASFAGLAPAPFDPLETLISAAHAEGIEVHAWVSVTGMWKDLGASPPDGHVFGTHGPGADGTDNWALLRSDGANHFGDEYLFDPGHPDAADYIVRVATSIVASYAVDGLNLDRVRYPDGNLANLPSWGYNPTAVARFQAATGRSDRPATSDAQWTQWRRDRVTDLVRKIYLESYALRPRVRVSADTITYGAGPRGAGGWERTRTYAELLQDWRGWLAEGILDLNIAMNYKHDSLANQRQWFRDWSDFTKDSQYGRAGAVGTALYINDVAGSVRQVRESVRASAAGAESVGWVGYSYRTPDDVVNAGRRGDAAVRADLAGALTLPSRFDPNAPPVFADPAPVPDMPWKTRPTTGHVSGIAPRGDARVELLNDATGALVRVQTSDARGWFGFVDVAPDRYRVRSGTESAITSLEPGMLARVMLGAPAASLDLRDEGPLTARASAPTALPRSRVTLCGQSN